jgi:hypothetical protein
MKLCVSILSLATALLWNAPGYAGCSPKQLPSCAAQSINLTDVAEISQQIIGKEPQAPAQKATAPNDATAPYSGPTVGVSDRVRRAATVGYQWALH